MTRRGAAMSKLEAGPIGLALNVSADDSYLRGPAEVEGLYNYPDFDPDAVLAHVDDILIGAFRLPVAAQAFVLRKPAGDGR